MLAINQVSYNSNADLDDTFNDPEVDNSLIFSQNIPHAKKYLEDDIGLRIASTQRRSFAQQYLFQSGAKGQDEQDAFTEGDYSDHDNDTTDQFMPGSHENSGYQCSSFDLSAPTPVMTKSVSMFCQEVSLPIAAIPEEQEDLSSDDENNAPKNSDMFFSCADWETIRESDKKTMPEPVAFDSFSESDEDLIDRKFTSKRM